MYTKPSSFPLVSKPTPLQPMVKLKDYLQSEYNLDNLPDLWVKRDDMTGLGYGGNKLRKLEYIVADAREKGADCLVTMGGFQSNHCRQTAAAAVKAGMDCYLVLQRNVGRTDDQYEETGNLVLNSLLGAHVTFIDMDTDRQGRTEELVAELQKQGRNPYLVVLGGSNGLGGFGYVEAMEELNSQASDLGFSPDVIVSAAASGGTTGGLAAGAILNDLSVKVLGVDVGDEPDYLLQECLRVMHETLLISDWQGDIPENALEIISGFGSPGYGMPNDAMKKALQVASRTEALFLDPVYSGKAFAGFLDLAINQYRESKNLVFIHTGGMPAIYAYRSDLGPESYAYNGSD